MGGGRARRHRRLAAGAAPPAARTRSLGRRPVSRQPTRGGRPPPLTTARALRRRDCRHRPRRLDRRGAPLERQDRQGPSRYWRGCCPQCRRGGIERPDRRVPRRRSDRLRRVAAADAQGARRRIRGGVPGRGRREWDRWRVRAHLGEPSAAPQVAGQAGRSARVGSGALGAVFRRVEERARGGRGLRRAGSATTEPTFTSSRSGSGAMGRELRSPPSPRPASRTPASASAASPPSTGSITCTTSCASRRCTSPSSDWRHCSKASAADRRCLLPQRGCWHRMPPV